MSEEQGLTKKELREQKRAEKQARKSEEESRAKKESFTQNIFTWGLVAILGVGLILFVGNLRPDEATIEGGNQGPEIAESDWVKGNPEAGVTLLEYGDFMCPGCVSAYANVEPMLEKYGDDINFVFRYYQSIPGLKSNGAARAAVAAGEQGKYYEMYSLLFEDFNALSSATNFEALFMEYAEELDLDLEAFEADYNSSAVRDWLSASAASGERLGVNSTPTFFLNGQRVNFSNYNQLDSLIADAIEQSKAEVETPAEEDIAGEGEE